MPINEWLLPEFDHEMVTTRKLLDRVGDETFAYKPHDKSFAMGSLAIHIARIPTWTKITIDQDSLDLAAPGSTETAPKTKTELVTLFDENVRVAHDAIAAVPDDVLFKPWSLMNGTTTLLTMPKVAILRSFVMNHLIHHRGQLSVYLRLNNIPVPSIYGPSADESGF